MKKLIVATNLTDVHKGPSFLDELLTQIVNGTTVEVLEEYNEKWLRVREEGGYEGYVFRTYLEDVEPVVADHILVRDVHLFDSPTHITERPSRIVGHLLMSTNVRIAETMHGAWNHIFPSGSMLADGWVNCRYLRGLNTLPRSSEMARPSIIAKARELTGVYYLWGGNSEWGTDCSGLVMMTHRLAGYTLPRDAWMQHRDAKKVDAAQPGDLFFFWNDARTKISHVGICTGGWNMIHSSRARNGVYEEDIQKNPKLMESLAGAGTFLG